MNSHYSAAKIRKNFIEFFQQRGHQFVRSAPVVPLDDHTLLFVNAGMNQFKDVFTEIGQREYTRAVNSQKCIRASGKHNDLEDVGLDQYHHTFFEMLGNWSFGDYFKREAIQWAWQLLVEQWKLDDSRLYATVFSGNEAEKLPPDTETEAIWTEVTPLPSSKVLHFGKDDNFWEMGSSGPCGPCSELHYDLGSQVDCISCRTANRECAVNMKGCTRFIELWNLVFIQFNRSEEGQLARLPSKHVDTGMGLERITRVLQGKNSNYETDLFTPIMQALQDISGSACLIGDDGIAARVISDHLRALCCAISDGAMPSNEGRGYVLRRMLRRAVRFGSVIGQQQPFIYKLVPLVGKVLGETFPELLKQATHTSHVIEAEEASFHKTLARGMERFNSVISQLPGNILPGEEMFRLYDTYGFPTDLTEMMAREKNISVEIKGFKQCMKKQQSQARAARNIPHQRGTWHTITNGKNSQFIGYQELIVNVTIRRWMIDNQQLILLLDKTPFYPQGGGQIADKGTLSSLTGCLSVIDVYKEGDLILHICEVLPSSKASEKSSVASSSTPASFSSILPEDGCLQAVVSPLWRDNIQRNHTGTHLLHAALRQVLGEHVHQAGSVVTPQQLRFDFTHFEKVYPDQLNQIEHLANQAIRDNIPIQTHHTSYDQAISQGAMSLFGEKYGEQVRVITIGSFSKELCGGCHTPKTGKIGFFKITSEGSIASGIRRITAITGETAQKWIQQEHQVLNQCKQLLQVNTQQLHQKIQQLLQQGKEFKQQIKILQQDKQTHQAQSLLKTAQVLPNRTKLITQQIQASTLEELQTLADKLRKLLNPSVTLLSSLVQSKQIIVCAVSDDLVKKGLKAGTIVNQVAQFADGKGGGPPHLAAANAPNLEKLSHALKQAPSLIQKLL